MGFKQKNNEHTVLFREIIIKHYFITNAYIIIICYFYNKKIILPTHKVNIQLNRLPYYGDDNQPFDE
jgi:hypothetical protein